MPRNDVTVEMRADSRRLQRDLYRARREWSAYSRQVRSQVRGLAREAALVATAAAGAVTTLITASTRQFEAYNRELIKTRTLVGITTKEFEQLNRVVIDVARTTGVSLEDIANASVGVFSAQVRGAQAFRIITAAAKLQALGFGEARTQADLLTGSVRTYGDTVLSVARAGDIFFAAVREGNFDPQLLASSLSRVLPVARQLGIPLKDVAGAIASLSLVNVNPNRAATGLVAILSAIIKPSQQAIDVLKEFNLTIDDLRAAVADKGLIETLDATFSLFGGDLDAIGRVFPQLEGLPQLLSLVGERAEETKVIIDRLDNSSGDLDVGFRELLDSGTQAFTLLAREASILGVKLGEAISAELRSRADDVTQALQQMAQYIPQVASTIVAFSSNVARAVRFLYDNRTAIGELIKAYIGLRIAIVGTTVAVAAVRGIAVLATTFTAVAKSAAGLRVAMSALGRSTIILTAAVSAVIYFYGLFRRAVGEVTPEVQALNEQIAGVLSEIDNQGAQLPGFDAAIATAEAQVLELDKLLKGTRADIVTKNPALAGSDIRRAELEQEQATLQALEAEQEAALAAAEARLAVAKSERAASLARTMALREELGAIQAQRDAAEPSLLSPTANALEGLQGITEEATALVRSAAESMLTETNAAVQAQTDQTVENLDAIQGVLDASVFEDAPDPTVATPDIEPFRFDGGVLGSAIVSGIDESIRDGGARSLGTSILEGINSTVQSAASNVLQAGINSVFRAAFGDTLQNVIESGLTKIFSSAFDAVGSLLGGLFGAAGAAAGAGAVTAPTAHGGGYIPGFRGQEVPIIAQAGELVLTERQQQRLLGGNGTNLTINATGDVDAATQRALAVSGRQVAHLLQQQRREGVYVG